MDSSHYDDHVKNDANKETVKTPTSLYIIHRDVSPAMQWTFTFEKGFLILKNINDANSSIIVQYSSREGDILVTLLDTDDMNFGIGTTLTLTKNPLEPDHTGHVIQMPNVHV